MTVVNVNLNTVVTQLLHCFYTVVPLLSHCCYTIGAMTVVNVIFNAWVMARHTGYKQFLLV
jgi:hypothetical protein